MDSNVKSGQHAQAVKWVVLLVEDHFDTRWATAAYLRDVGAFRVIEAVDSAEAKAVLQTATNIDLVFTDIYMPDRGSDDGYGLAQWVATHYPKLPVVLTSGEHEDWTAYTRSGLRAFIRKPYDLERVVSIMGQMVGA